MPYDFIWCHWLRHHPLHAIISTNKIILTSDTTKNPKSAKFCPNFISVSVPIIHNFARNSESFCIIVKYDTAKSRLSIALKQNTIHFRNTDNFHTPTHMHVGVPPNFLHFGEISENTHISVSY